MVATAALAQWLRPEPACRWQHEALKLDSYAWAALPLPRNGVGRTRDDGQTLEWRTCSACCSTIARQVYTLRSFIGNSVGEFPSVDAALAWLAWLSGELPFVEMALETSGDEGFSTWIVNIDTGKAIAEITS